MLLSAASLTTAAVAQASNRFAQVVDGNRLVATPYNLSFRRGIQRAVLCTQQLSSRHLDVLRKVATRFSSKCKSHRAYARYCTSAAHGHAVPG